MQNFTIGYLLAALRSLANLMGYSYGKSCDSSAYATLKVPVEKKSKKTHLRKMGQFLLLLGFLIGGSTAVRAQVDIVGSVPAGPINPTDTFTVTISLSSTNQDVNGAEVHLDFNPAFVTVTGLNPLGASAGLSQTLVPAAFDNTAGTIDYGAGIPITIPTTPPIDGNFDFLEITFQAVSAGNTNLDFVNILPLRSTEVTLSGSVLNRPVPSIPISIVAANQDPVASFTIVPNPAETNEVVTFDGSGSTDDGTVDLYAWDFGDGTTQPASSNASTTHSYTAANTYTVALTVTDNLSVTNTTTQTIVVTAPTVTQYTVNASAGPNGSISPSGAVSVNEGDDQSFTITPDPGFEITEILVNTVPQTIANPFVLTNVQANADLEVNFSLIPPFQVCIASGSGDLTAFGRDFTGDPNTTPPATSEFSRINGKAYTGYNGAIAGTGSGSAEELLFQKEIYGGAGGGNPSYSYSIPVTNGFYEVDLYFAEVFHPNAGGRIFDVILEGNTILDEYDPVDPIKDGLPSNQTAITRTYIVEVTDGTLDVQIGPASTDNGKLSGICVTETSNTNTHPVTAIGDLTFQATVPVAETLNILDGDQLSITFNGLPGSLIYDAPSNQIQGTPLIGDVGSFTINAIISDGNSAPVTEEFTLNIDAPPGNDPPAITEIDDINIALGATASTGITVTDDNNVFNTTFVLYDKSLGGNNPALPNTVIPDTEYSFTDNGSGSYSFSWNTTGPPARPGRSYLARVTTDDGVNPPVEELFSINVAQNLPGIITANTFANPLPWYGANTSGAAPGEDFSVSIETAGNIGYVNNNDFVAYLIEVPTAGDYEVRFNSSNGSGSDTDINIFEEGNAVSLGFVNVPSNGWGNFDNFTTTVTLANTGLQTLRLEFNGGVNTNEIEFTPLTGNAAPVVTITNPANGSIITTDTSINFTGTAIDDNDGDISTSISWSSDLDNALGVGASISTTLSVGTHVITAEATDSDAIQLTGTATITLIVVESAPTCDVRFRVNAGGPSVISATGDFEEDQASSLVGGSAQTGTPSPYVNTAAPAVDKTFGSTVALVSNTTGYPDYLFQTERYSDAANPNNMKWAFPTGNGVFEVKILFNENWINENNNVNNNRIFDVLIEGDLAFDNYRPSGPAGADFNVAKVETYTATVVDGVLNIDFEKINQNPAVKGFDICFISDIVTLPPVFTLEIPDQNNLEGDTPVGLAVAANDPDGGTVTFSDNGTLPPGLSIDPNTGVVSGTIDVGAAANSPYNVVITATDDEPETETSSFTWTVNAPVTLPLCINSGNQGPVTAFGKPFIADSYVTPAGGNFYNTPDTQAIAGTTPGSGEEDMFQSEHWTGAAGGLQYSIPTGNGDFTIDLYMAELFANAANVRILDITIEGVTVLTGLDLFGTYGKFTAATLTYDTTVNDGFLDIAITSTADNPKLNGLCVSATAPDTPPVVNITAPADNAPVTRGTDVTLTATANDFPDGDISANIDWSSSDIQFTPSATTGASITAKFVTPGSQTVTASVIDSGAQPGSDQITVNVGAPSVVIDAPGEGDTVTSTDVTLQWTGTNVLDNPDYQEHYHIYVNPPDINNIDTGTRISTASALGQEFWNLTAINGIVEGANTVVIRIANQFHEEFPGIQDVVNFTVELPDVTDPEISCPTDITVDNDPGVCGAIVNFTPPVGTDDRPGPITTQTAGLASGSFFPVGTTTQTFLVTDLAGNTAECSFDITVNDTENPVVSCPADDSVDVDTNGEFILADYTSAASVTDNCDSSFTVTQSPLAGTVLSSDTVVTLSVTDTAGNTGTCTLNVNISEDTTNPVISCPTDIVVDTDAGVCGAVVNFTPPVGTDERPGATTSQLAGLASGDLFPVGTTTQTYQVMDAAGNMASCSFTVTVNDNENPVISCPANISMVSPTPEVLTIVPATATDACGIASITGVRSDGLLLTDPFPLAPTTITWTAVDVNGNSDVCLQTVTITAPQSGANDILAFDVPGQVGNETIDGTGKTVELTVAAGIVVNGLTPTIDISTAASINPTSGTPQDFTNPVIYTVTAENGSEQPWTVTVVIAPDMVDPEITCPADIVVNNDPGQCGAVVTYTVPVGTDNLSGATTALTAGLASGDLFPVGVTTVTYTVTDAAGLTASCSFTVTVVDNEAPVVSCPPAQTLQGDINADAVLPDYAASVSLTDNCDASPILVQSPAPGTIINGATVVTMTATDADGNTSSCTFEVTVEVDLIPPAITCPADIVVSNDAGQCGAVVNYTVPVGTDNEPGAVTVLSGGLGSGAFFPVGTTTETYTVTDAIGNSATCSFTVTVNDDEAPLISCPADITVNVASGVSSAVVNYAAPSGTDNCPGASTSQTAGLGSGASFPVGTTTETYTVTDAAGNSASCSFTVTVEALPSGSLEISPTSIEVTLFPDQVADVNYVVDSDNGSTLPTPAAMKITDDATGLDATWAATTSAANQGVPYEVSFNSAGLAPGTYTGLLTAGPVTGYTDVSIPITLIVDPIPPFGIIQFILVDADDDVNIMPITNNMVIDVNSLPTDNLNIIAIATGATESVQLQLSGPQNNTKTENVPPYALYGDSNGNYAAQQFALGVYTITATPYSGNSLGGNAGTPFTVNFEFSDQDPLCDDFIASLNGVNDPNTCNASDGTASVAVTGGSGNYSYAWDNGSTTSSVSNLSSGPHSVTVTDTTFGCTQTFNFNLSDPALPIVTLLPFSAVLDSDAPFALSGGSPSPGTYSGTGVNAAGVFDPSVGPGTFLITYTYTDGNGCSNSASQSIVVNPESANSALIVLDATTDTPLYILTEGLQINKNDIGNTPLGIIYNADLNPGGVAFNLTGPINESRFEGPAPHSLFGDIGVNIQGKPFPIGNYTLVANPNSGPTITVNFSVIDGPPGNIAPTAVANGTTDPVDAFVVNFSSAGSDDPDGTIVNYSWDFGDGNGSNQENPSHTYGAAGTYNVTLIVTDNNNATGNTSIQVTALDPNDVDKVVSFTLIDATTNNDLFDILNGDVITDGQDINIRANTDPGLVGSVVMQLSGPVNASQTESFAPYALFGDVSGNFLPGDLPPGFYTLTATPYSASGGNGTPGQSLTIDFSVILAPPARQPIDFVTASPNPADREVRMSFEEPIQVEGVMMYDMTGRLVKTVNSETPETVESILVRVQDLPAGTYFARIRDLNGREFQERVVIKR